MKNQKLELLDWSEWPLPDNCLIELGRIAALWASLDNFLNICIGKLSGFEKFVDPKPFILLNHSSFPQRLDMLGSLCSILYEEFPNLSGYKEVISKLRSAQASRNKYLHNAIGQSEDHTEFEIAQGSARGTLKTSISRISIGDIRRASAEIDEAFRELYRLITETHLNPAWENKEYWKQKSVKNENDA